MSEKKKIKDLKNSEVEQICDNANGCVNCPLLISSYHREIHCIRDDNIKRWEIEEAYNLFNKEIEV